MYQLIYTYSIHVSWVTELCQESLLVRVGQELIYLIKISELCTPWAVTHPSTDTAHPRLTSVITRP